MQFLLNQICLKCRVKLCMLSKSMSSSAKNGINIAVFQQLGFTQNEAKQMIARYKRIGKLNTATLEQRLAYIKINYLKIICLKRDLPSGGIETLKCKLSKSDWWLQKLGFNQGEIVKCPNILGLTTALVDHHYKILEESGFSVREIKLDSLTYKCWKQSPMFRNVESPEAVIYTPTILGVQQISIFLSITALYIYEEKPSYMGAQLWNNLLEDLKICDPNTFKREVKKWVLSNPFYSEYLRRNENGMDI